MKKTKKTAIGLLTSAMLLSCGTAGVVTAFAADGDASAPAAIGWVDGSGTTVEAAGMLGGSYHISSMDNGGDWASTDRKVTLDGLTVTFRGGDSATAAANQTGYGIGLAQASDNDHRPALGTTNVLNAFLWKGLFGGGSQTRLTMQTTHDFNATQLAWGNPELTTRPAPASDGQYVINTEDGMVTVSMKFAYVPDHDVWSAVISTLDDSGSLDNKYKFASQANPTTVYFSHDYVKDAIDSDGKCYIFAYGMGGITDAYFKAEEGEGGGYGQVNVTSVALSATKTTIEYGESVEITAAIDKGATAQTVAWEVDGEAVAGSSLSYTLAGARVGTHTVKCTVNGIASEPLTITVNNVTVPDSYKGWTGKANDVSAEYMATMGGSAHITGLNSVGSRAVYNEKVALDGLTVTMMYDEATIEAYKDRIDNTPSFSAPLSGNLGFGFAQTADSNPISENNAVNMTVWLLSNVQAQIRGGLCSNNRIYGSNYGDFSIGYTQNDNGKLSSAWGGGNGIVWNNSEKQVALSVTFLFDSVTNVWRAEVESLKGTVILGAMNNKQTVYFAKEWADSVLDEDGKCYLVGYGEGNVGGYFKVESNPVWTASNSETLALSSEMGGSTHVSGLAQNGYAHYNHKVLLNGLTVKTKLGESSAAKKSALGFGLASDPATAGKFNFSTVNDGTPSLAIGERAYTVSNPMAFADVDLEQVASLSFKGAPAGATVAYAFEYLPRYDVWQVNITVADAAVQTVYLSAEEVESILDKNGCCYIVAYGLDNADGYFAITAQKVEEESKVYEDGEWAFMSGGLGVEYDPETGYSHIIGVRPFNVTAAYSDKVTLEGLKIIMKLGGGNKAANNIGFGLAKYQTDCPIALGQAQKEQGNGRQSFNAIFWPEQSYVGVGGNNGWNNSAGKTALLFGYSHNYHHDRITYPTADLTMEDGDELPQTSGAHAFLLNTREVATPAVSLEFHKVSETVWSVTVRVVEGEAITELQDGAITYYFSADYANSVLDEDGKCYIVVDGIGDDLYMKVEDDAIRTYNAGALAAAEEKAQAFQTAVEAITDADSYEASLTARNAFLGAIEALRPNGKSAYTARLAQIDALYRSRDIQPSVKASLDAELNKVAAIFETLGTDANITGANVAAAKKAIADCKAFYENMKGMLTERNVYLFEEDIAAYDYSYEVVNATLWVKGLEDMVAGFATSTDIGADIVLALEYNLAYTGSELEATVATFKTADKEAFEARRAAVNEQLDAAYEQNAEAIKGGYLTVFENALKEDLTQKDKLDAAKGYNEKIKTLMPITEADGELYTRYQAAYAKLESALEAFVSKQISDISDALDGEITSLEAFNVWREAFYAVDTSYYYDANETIEAAYAALREKIQENVFWCFVRNGGMESDVELTDDGLYFEQIEYIPARLNYDRDFDIASGIEIEFRLDEIAYYNANDFANNLCFNFMADPGKDRKDKDAVGFSLYLWFYGATTEIDIYNYTDNSVKVGSISTPDDGDTVKVKVWREEIYDLIRDETYMAWMFQVNEWKGSLSDSAITVVDDNNVEHTVDRLLEHCYLSFATYMDRRNPDEGDRPNRYTLIRVNDVVFGKASQEEGVTGVQISADKTQAKKNEQVTFTATLAPAGVTAQEIAWFVNGVKQEATGAQFVLTASETGEYTVYCTADNVKSNEVKITVNEGAATGGCAGCGSSITAYGTLSLCLLFATVAGATLVCAKKRNKH